MNPSPSALSKNLWLLLDPVNTDAVTHSISLSDEVETKKDYRGSRPVRRAKIGDVTRDKYTRNGSENRNWKEGSCGGRERCSNWTVVPPIASSRHVPEE